MIKGTLGCREYLNLSVKQLGSSEGMLVLVLCFLTRAKAWLNMQG